jgi:hypothetical protein
VNNASLNAMERTGISTLAEDLEPSFNSQRLRGSYHALCAIHNRSTAGKPLQNELRSINLRPVNRCDGHLGCVSEEYEGLRRVGVQDRIVRIALKGLLTYTEEFVGPSLVCNCVGW